MKKILLTITIFTFLFGSLVFTSCGGDEKTDENDSTKSDTVAVNDADNDATPKPGVIPVDFPTVSTTAKSGEYVLAPSYAFIENAWEDVANGMSPSFTFYSATCSEPGSVESKIKQISGEYMIPNSLIIAIPAGQEVHKGDIVLTWWQSGSGMQRAIVVDDANPKMPKVKYLDLAYDNPATNKDGVPIGQMIEELKENSFVKITAEMQPGTSIAVKGDYNTEKWQVLRVDGNKVLAIGWVGKTAVFDKSACTAIPVKPNLKAGDIVQVPNIGSYTEGTVKKVDATAGRVWVEIQFAGSAKEIVVSMGDIAMSL